VAVTKVEASPEQLSHPPGKKACQAAGDLAVGQASLLVEFDDGGLGIGANLSGSGAEGIGRL
jgi:hypothetical protein